MKIWHHFLRTVVTAGIAAAICAQSVLAAPMLPAEASQPVPFAVSDETLECELTAKQVQVSTVAVSVTDDEALLDEAKGFAYSKSSVGDPAQAVQVPVVKREFEANLSDLSVGEYTIWAYVDKDGERTYSRPISFAVEPQTFGLDNLNNEPGDLTIAFLGGSITEGYGASNPSKRYADLVTEQYFRKQYPNKTVHEVCAGVSGTPSDLGLFRLDQEIISASPDVVFVDFAVNDYSRIKVYPPEQQPQAEREIQQTMEGIVRQLMKLPKQPVVIFVYMSKDNSEEVVSELHDTVANYYEIGSLNIDAYKQQLVSEGKLKFVPQWSNDGVHPNDKGCQEYANFTIREFEQNYDRYFTKIKMQQQPMSGYDYGRVQAIPAGTADAVYTGSWQKDTSTLKERFPQGTMKTSTPGDSLRLNFTGRTIGVYANRVSNGAEVAYSIDGGKYTGTFTNYYPSGAMGVATFLRSDLDDGPHTIEFIVKETAGRNLFQLGYFFVDEVLPADTSVVPAEGIRLDQTECTLAVGQTQKLTAQVLPENATNTGVLWSSSDPAVAQVDADGNVTAVAGGMAFITATAQDGGYSAVCMVTVQGGVDVSALKALCEECRSKNENEYTALSWTVFQDALKKAEDVLASSEVTQAQVDASLRALQDACDRLEKVETPEPDGSPAPSTAPTQSPSQPEDSGSVLPATGDTMPLFVLAALLLLAAAGGMKLVYASKKK